MSTGAVTHAEGVSRSKVLLVDDSTAVRQGLRTLLGLVDDLEVVGEAADGADALEEARRLRPDAIVLDLEMPIMDGITTARRLKTLLPCCRLVVLSVHADETRRRLATKAGVDAFLVKGESLSRLVEALGSTAPRTERSPW